MSRLRTRRSYRWVWFWTENVPQKTLLNQPKFHLITSSGSGVILQKGGCTPLYAVRVKPNGLNKLAWIFKMFLFDKINSFPKAINFVKSNTNSSNISVFISTKTFLTIIRLFKRLKVRNLFQKLWKISESLRVKRKWWSLNEQLKLSPFRSW